MGEDWGSGSGLAGFNPLYNFSIVVAQNTAYGGNCEQLTGYQWFQNFFAMWDLTPALLDLTLQYMSKGENLRL